MFYPFSLLLHLGMWKITFRPEESRSGSTNMKPESTFKFILIFGLAEGCKSGDMNWCFVQKNLPALAVLVCLCPASCWERVSLNHLGIWFCWINIALICWSINHLYEFWFCLWWIFQPEVTWILLPRQNVLFKHSTALFHSGSSWSSWIVSASPHLNFCILRKRSKKLASVLQLWMCAWNRGLIQNSQVKCKFHTCDRSHCLISPSVESRTFNIIGLIVFLAFHLSRFSKFLKSNLFLILLFLHFLPHANYSM